jgi:conjugative relaxase-like TrwC/TraI family protein
MLRILPSKSVKQAKSYYTSSLKQEKLGQGHYYAQEQELIGQWCGRGAARLGLQDQVDQKAFEALCENIHPTTGQRLTPRTRENRRIGYDFNFNCPKSVSSVQALTGDDRIVTAFRQSVAETMQEIETDALTRVRKQGAQTDRAAGNLVWGEFIHFTARPVEGQPDPHLHAHCFVFNATWDENEKRWKAAQFGDIKRDGRYYEAAFHARLSRRVADLGYAIQRKDSFWEIEGVPRSVVEKFSQRTEAIEEEAAEKGITDPKKKAELGGKTREQKIKVPLPDLKSEWLSRLTPEEKAALVSVRENALKGGYRFQKITPRQALDYAVEHCFENASVVPEKKLLEEALRYGVGQVEVDTLQAELGKMDLIRREMDGQVCCTTLAILKEEGACVRFVKEGRGTCRALNPGPYVFRDLKLSAEQQKAVLHVIHSRDRVMAIRGPAGAGKTRTMTEAVAAIEAGGWKVFTFAPSAEASRGALRKEGFSEAQTVAHLLLNTSLHQKIHGQVLWIDEAGLLSSPQMHSLFQLAEKERCRVVLVGDTAQHTAVERGDALRLLENHAGIEAAALTENRRQKFQGHREAVAHLRQGRAEEGLAMLDKLKGIEEIPDDAKRYQRLAQDYAQAIDQKKTVVVVSPTHSEGEQVTTAIRETLRQQNKLGVNETIFPSLHNLHWSAAQRQEPHRYEPGLVVQFHRDTSEFKNGEQVRITGRDEAGAVMVERSNGEKSVLPVSQAKDFQVFEQKKLALAVGDKIKITRNGQTLDGRAVSNGEIGQIKGFTKDGNIRLTNHAVLPKNYGNLSYGYCVTSHGSQGKTVDQVLIAQSNRSERAAYREQFYVSASRFRETIHIYTDNKRDLQQAIIKTGVRVSATDMVNGLNPVKQPVTERELLWKRLFQYCRQQFNETLKPALRPAETPRYRPMRNPFNPRLSTGAAVTPKITPASPSRGMGM